MVLLLYELIYVYSNYQIVKMTSYTNHIYMVSLLYYLFKCQDCKNHISHKSDLYIFTPVCICLCFSNYKIMKLISYTKITQFIFFKLPDCENYFSHKSHLNVLLLYELIYVYSNCRIVKLISYTKITFILFRLCMFIQIPRL